MDAFNDLNENQTFINPIVYNKFDFNESGFKQNVLNF